MFPTEQEIYHRLRWDPRFDVRRCHVVISLRPSGTQRMPLLDFDLEAIPWHRIVEFWVDDELAWSRPRRIDRLDELAARTEPPAEPARSTQPALVPLAPQRFDASRGRWSDDVAPAPAPAPAPRLRVVAWNLLFDRFLAEELDSERRWRAALDELAALDADLIALVEVTAAMRALILAQPWVRAAYATSHGPEAPIPRYGQILLARHGIAAAGELPLARDKRAVIARVPTPLGELGVAAIHLISNRAGDAPLVRGTQLAAILAHLRGEPRTWLLAGDFNADPAELDPALAPLGAEDCWELAHPGAPGFTFDVERNPLAARMSQRGRSARYDRILVLPGSSAVRTVACELAGTEHGDRPPSDHFGVVADLASASRALDIGRAPASRRTALVLMPPRDAWGPVQRVRCALDGKFRRWPPHVTLLFPFVDEAWLEPAAAALAAIVAEVAPFELAFGRAGPINPRTTVLWPTPAAARSIDDLFARLRAPFAALLDPGAELRAHLTVARGAPARTGGEPVSLDDLGVRWTVDRLTIVVERDGRYEPVREILLGRADPPLLPPSTPPLDPTLIEPVLAELRRSARSLAGDEAADGIAIHAFGSAIYAPEHAGDLDLVMRTGACPARELAELLADAHGLAIHGPPWRLRGSLAGRRLDMVVLAGDEPDAERWLAGPRDAELLREHLRDHGRDGAFRAAWPHVRAFSRARALDRNGLGYFGGFGWALLLAIPLCHDARVCAAPAGRVLAPWLRWLGALRPGARLGLDELRAGDPEPLYLAAPAPPSRNVARFMTAGTAATLFAELRRAARLLGDTSDLADADARSRVAAELALDPPPGATLVVRGTGDLARGRYEGLARRLIGELEAAHAPLRVWGRFEATTTTTAAWEHRITVPAARAEAALALAAAFLGDPDPGPEPDLAVELRTTASE